MYLGKMNVTQAYLDNKNIPKYKRLLKSTHIKKPHPLISKQLILNKNNFL